MREYNQEKLSYEDFFQESRQVYDWLEDDTSKNIWSARMMWYLTGQTTYLKQLIHHGSPYVKERLALFQSRTAYDIDFEKEEIVILYGAGVCGQITLHDVPVALRHKLVICDKAFDVLKQVEGIPIISPEELLQKYKTEKIIVSTGRYIKETYEYLIDNHVEAERLYSGFIHDYQHQYFENDLIDITEDTVFVDGGVFDGSSSLDFAAFAMGKYKKIYAFEPDEMAFENTKKNFEETDIRVVLIPKGLWNREEELLFQMGTGGSGTLDLDSTTCNGVQTVKVKVDTLDRMIPEEEWQDLFIKMDIETAELKALYGAEAIIKSHKPQLAICIYHLAKDLIDIFHYLKELVPEYEFTIRHYTSHEYETVLYAVAKR